MASEALEMKLSSSTKEAKEAADFANYFCTYSYLYHQKQMLEDRSRMTAYHAAIMSNPEQFRDKVVLDVGTGSGILAMWAAQAGARKVYAVEYTDMATHARTLVEANGLGDRIEVLQGAIEDLEIPEQVDIIVSEWMGYLLVRESMIDSVIVARERFMKPGGAMYPSHASVFVAPVAVEQQHREKMNGYQRAMGEWHEFTRETTASYGVDMTGVTTQFETEQREFFMQTATWEELGGEQQLADEVNCWEIDMNTVTVAEVEAVREAAFRFEFDQDANVTGITGWFDVEFRGSDANPAANAVTLSTSPSAGYTHWGQQLFLLSPAVNVRAGDVIEGTMDISRRPANHRLLDVQLTYSAVRATPPAGAPVMPPVPPRSVVYRVD